MIIIIIISDDCTLGDGCTSTCHHHDRQPVTQATCCVSWCCVRAQDTGEVLSSWGSGEFLMPHGLTVDLDGNIWVTDCGLHQAIKFSPQGKQLLALGTRLKPGHDSSHLCKPTHVS